VRHGQSPLGLSIELLEDAVRVAVHDVAAGAPVAPRAPGLEESAGRGLAIVDACSRDWGVDSDERGKWVWAIVAVQPD
jgi:hypothetical protein